MDLVGKRRKSDGLLLFIHLPVRIVPLYVCNWCLNRAMPQIHDTMDAVVTCPICLCTYTPDGHSIDV
jgi:hypothetical protein